MAQTEKTQDIALKIAQDTEKPIRERVAALQVSAQVSIALSRLGESIIHNSERAPGEADPEPKVKEQRVSILFNLPTAGEPRKAKPEQAVSGVDI